MARRTWRSVGGLALVCALGSTGPLFAQLGIGTWTPQSGPLASMMTMTVEACCNGGFRLIYNMKGSDAAMTIETPADGSEVPVLVAGKPSGETMAIKRVDDHHTVTVLKMNGKVFGTSKSALSADGKTLTVDNEIEAALAGQPAGKRTDIWVRK